MSSRIEMVDRTDTPSNPPAGYASLFVRDGEPHLRFSDGSEYPFSGVFGNDYQQTRRTDLQTITGTTESTYLTLNTNNLDTSGKYRLGIGFTWNYNDTGSDFRGRFYLNGDEFMEEFRCEPKDANADQRFDFFRAYTFEPGELLANNQFQFTFSASINGETARVYRGEMEIWRVG